MLCDLHVHSTFSDGTFTPTELIAHAQDIGLKALALCDHNTVDGLKEFAESGKKSTVTAVPGIEISTEHQGKELHILGLFLPMHRLDEVAKLLEKTKELKEQSNRELVENLARDGYIVDYEKLKSENEGSYINRAHIAASLTDSGYTTSIKEAFSTLLHPDNGYYKEPKRLETTDVIEFIKSIGAVCVWAHPFLNMDADSIDQFLPVAKKHGLDGMETIYTTYCAKTQAIAQELCLKYALAQSGGSDFHGDKKPDVQMGVGHGNLRIPFEFFGKLNPGR